MRTPKVHIPAPGKRAGTDFPFTSQPLKVESGWTGVKAIYKFREKNALGAKIPNSMECKINTGTEALYDIQNPQVEE